MRFEVAPDHWASFPSTIRHSVHAVSIEGSLMRRYHSPRLEFASNEGFSFSVTNRLWSTVRTHEKTHASTWSLIPKLSQFHVFGKGVTEDNIGLKESIVKISASNTKCVWHIFLQCVLESEICKITSKLTGIQSLLRVNCITLILFSNVFICCIF